MANKLFQSTLPHGERPGGRQPTGTNSMISIHAPAWGATPSGREKLV